MSLISRNRSEEKFLDSDTVEIYWHYMLSEQYSHRWDIKHSTRIYALTRATNEKLFLDSPVRGVLPGVGTGTGIRTSVKLPWQRH